MAQIIDNTKGFKVIECTLSEVQNFGGIGICDYCNNAALKGYYIAVMNRWYCEKCYTGWMKRAVRYPEDMHIEDRNFNAYRQILNV